MGRSLESLHWASHTDLLRMSRDTLRRAAAVRPQHVPPQLLVEGFGLLSSTITHTDAALLLLRDQLWRQADTGGLVVVDGPFAGEPEQALQTMDLWIRRGRDAAAEQRAAVDNAHTVAAGFAAPC